MNSCLFYALIALIVYIPSSLDGSSSSSSGYNYKVRRGGYKPAAPGGYAWNNIRRTQRDDPKAPVGDAKPPKSNNRPKPGPKAAPDGKGEDYTPDRKPPKRDHDPVYDPKPPVPKEINEQLDRIEQLLLSSTNVKNDYDASNTNDYTPSVGTNVPVDVAVHLVDRSDTRNENDNKPQLNNRIDRKDDYSVDTKANDDTKLSYVYTKKKTDSKDDDGKDRVDDGGRYPYYGYSYGGPGPYKPYSYPYRGAPGNDGYRTDSRDDDGKDPIDYAKLKALLNDDASSSKARSKSRSRSRSRSKSRSSDGYYGNDYDNDGRKPVKPSSDSKPSADYKVDGYKTDSRNDGYKSASNDDYKVDGYKTDSRKYPVYGKYDYDYLYELITSLCEVNVDLADRIEDLEKQLIIPPSIGVIRAVCVGPGGPRGISGDPWIPMRFDDVTCSSGSIEVIGEGDPKAKIDKNRKLTDIEDCERFCRETKKCRAFKWKINDNYDKKYDTGFICEAFSSDMPSMSAAPESADAEMSIFCSLDPLPCIKGEIITWSGSSGALPPYLLPANGDMICDADYPGMCDILGNIYDDKHGEGGDNICYLPNLNGKYLLTAGDVKPGICGTGYPVEEGECVGSVDLGLDWRRKRG